MVKTVKLKSKNQKTNINLEELENSVFQLGGRRMTKEEEKRFNRFLGKSKK